MRADAYNARRFGEDCTEPWNVVDSLYFVVVSISTVGYGDFAPTDTGSQLFTVVFCLIGIVFIFSELSQLIGAGVYPLCAWANCKMDEVFPPRKIDLNGDGRTDVEIPQRAFVYYSRTLLAPLALTVTLQLVSASIFIQLEDWTYWQVRDLSPEPLAWPVSDFNLGSLGSAASAQGSHTSARCSIAALSLEPPSPPRPARLPPPRSRRLSTIASSPP